MAGNSFLREIDLAGNTIREVTTADVNQALQAKGYNFIVTFFHHDILMLPNGHWMILANTSHNFTDLPGYPGNTLVIGDALIDLDPNTKNVTWAWNSFDHLDVNRHLMGLPDWTHGNAIIYAPDGNLLLSMRNQSWILKIDYENGAGMGDVLWRLGNGGDFALLGGDPSEWFYAQHYPSIFSTNGSKTTMTIWDNGNLRIDSSGTACGAAIQCYSRPTIFEIDEAARTASLAWQDLTGLFAPWGGSVDILQNGDVEFDLTSAFGPSSRILEVTQTATPQTVWQLDITGGNAYRGYRIPSLYPGVVWQQ